MLRAALADVRGNLRRLVATTLAVVFGIAFVAGTLIFSDTARGAYSDAFARQARNVDVFVEPGDSPQLTASQLDTVRRLPGVAAADGRMREPLALLDPRGRPVTNFGSVGIAVSTDGEAALRPYDVIGRSPNAGEAALDSDTASRLGYGIGDTITVVDPAGARHAYPLVGLIDFGVLLQVADSSVVGLPEAVITQLTSGASYDEIVVRARDGVSPSALTADVAAALGGATKVQTGDQRREVLLQDAASWTEAFRIFLLVFGVISLIVAAFVIYNTFAVLAAMRARQTALLRCVGATRAQVFGATVLESALVGLAGGAVGVLAGIGVARGLVPLLNSTLDARIPPGSAVLNPTVIVVGLVLGLAVTVAAALVPAVRATRTSPLASLRAEPTAITAVRRVVIRLILTALAGALGIGITVLGASYDNPQASTLLIVAGGIVTFLALLIVSPLLIGPLTSALGAIPARLFGTPARLATANAQRAPGRAAITTATLMIGVGIMSVATVVMSSAQATASRQIADQYPVDFVVTGVQYGGSGDLPAGYAAAVRSRAEFATVAQVRTANAKLGDTEIVVGAVEPAALGTLLTPPITSGRLADLGPGTVAVATTRDRLGPAPVGTTLTVSGAASTATVRVIATTPVLSPGVTAMDLLLPWSDFAALTGDVGDTAILVKKAPGVSPGAARAALDALTDTYPLTSIGSVAELSGDLSSIVDKMLGLIAGLLAITVIISLFGIANTLALSVVERTRESATVRALGLTRGQLRATLLLEALLMAAVGALVGLSFGLVYGAVLVHKSALRALQPILVVPWGWFAGIVLLATVTAVLAAVLPARRAARAAIVTAMADT